MTRRWGLFESVPGPGTYHPAEGHIDRWWLVRTPRLGVYVQRINVPMDNGPSLHTHPRAGITLVVRGGYDEKVERHYGNSRCVRYGERTRRTGSLYRMRTIDAHTITALRRCPTWTVVLVGRRRPEPSWGYWNSYDFTPLERTPRSGADRPRAARPRPDHRTGSSTGRGRAPTRPAPAGGHRAPC